MMDWLLAAAILIVAAVISRARKEGRSALLFHEYGNRPMRTKSKRIRKGPK